MIGAPHEILAGLRRMLRRLRSEVSGQPAPPPVSIDIREIVDPEFRRELELDLLRRLAITRDFGLTTPLEAWQARWVDHFAVDPTRDVHVAFRRGG